MNKIKCKETKFNEYKEYLLWRKIQSIIGILVVVSMYFAFIPILDGISNTNKALTYSVMEEQGNTIEYVNDVNLLSDLNSYIPKISMLMLVIGLFAYGFIFVTKEEDFYRNKHNITSSSNHESDDEAQRMGLVSVMMGSIGNH